MSKGTASLPERRAPTAPLSTAPTNVPAPAPKFALPARPSFATPPPPLPSYSSYSSFSRDLRRSPTPPLRRESDVYIPEEEARRLPLARADVYIPRSPSPPPRLYRSPSLYVVASPPRRRDDSQSSYSRSLSPLRSRRSRSRTPPRPPSTVPLLDPPHRSSFTRKKEESARSAQEEQQDRETHRLYRDESRHEPEPRGGYFPRGVPTGPRSRTRSPASHHLQIASYSTAAGLQRSRSATSLSSTSSATDKRQTPKRRKPKLSKPPKGVPARIFDDESPSQPDEELDMPPPRGPAARKKLGGAQGLLKQLPGPEHTQEQIVAQYQRNESPLKEIWWTNTKSPLVNYMMAVPPSKGDGWTVEEGVIEDSRKKIFRVTVVANEAQSIIGIGDHASKKEAEKLAALSALFQLVNAGLISSKGQPIGASAVPSEAQRVEVPTADNASITLMGGTDITYERARQFMDYYCRRYGFTKPEIDYAVTNTKVKGNKSKSANVSMWEAVMNVSGRRIGMGTAPSKKQAAIQCYLDVAKYLESCDPDLWKDFEQKVGKSSSGQAPHLVFQISDELNEDIQILCGEIKDSTLYANHPPDTMAVDQDLPSTWFGRVPVITGEILESKSRAMQERLLAYNTDPKLEKMRADRHSLPVYARMSEILAKISVNEVTILMAQTGSGKTTQVPQLILDDYINKNEGASCNIICTQPRRLAATSVAERIANERDQRLGEEVGYHVRFDSKQPKPHGSITFCTTGIFLKKMQSALGPKSNPQSVAMMDQISHIVVDEVHERDIDTDLVLVVLKQLLADRRARGVPLRVILMSATVDPTLFTNYFKDARGLPAPILEVPGRTYPVERHYLDDILPEVQKGLTPRSGGWVFSDKDVNEYIAAELSPRDQFKPDSGTQLKIPYALVALTIAHVVRISDDGHVLVFLPGWDEIKKTADILLDQSRPLFGLNFNDSSRFSVHYLHSSIPPAEQREVFNRPPEGVRRIILATNIAETSVTIPDVVHVIDIARNKEKMYDPGRHISSLVTGWVGLSNLNQRVGRAGRHRPGQYYGLLSQQRLATLASHQLVEMKRSDLSEVVMHVKALNLGEVEEVLAAAIEPPEVSRVAAARQSLHMLGALNDSGNVTALGRLLLQMPVNAAVGKLVLFGAFFRCLDSALTLAAALHCRDPFMSPVAVRERADDVKDSWSPNAFRSDPLAIVAAYNAWDVIDRQHGHWASHRFCDDNFLSVRSLLEIRQIKGSLLQALYQTGVITVATSGAVRQTGGRQSRKDIIPPRLNENGNSLPLLAALIATACAPNFAIRTSDKICQTPHDKQCFISTASVNARKRETGGPEEPTTSFNPAEKRLYAFGEKSEVVPLGGKASNSISTLRNVTRLDPLTYMLFGAYNLVVTDRGLECDGWLPVWGNVPALDDIQRLKTLLDACMLRVFEGVGKELVRERDERWKSAQHRVHVQPGTSRIDDAEDEGRDGDEGENESDDDEGDGDGNADAERRVPKRVVMPLHREEMKELEMLTTDIVRLLDDYAAEREGDSRSRAASRPTTAPTTALTTAANTRPTTPYGEAGADAGFGGVDTRGDWGIGGGGGGAGAGATNGGYGGARANVDAGAGAGDAVVWGTLLQDGADAGGGGGGGDGRRSVGGTGPQQSRQSRGRSAGGGGYTSAAPVPHMGPSARRGQDIPRRLMSRP